MKTIFEHVEHIKGKPHHVRKRVAFAVTTGISAFIALVWFIGSLSMGTFAIKGSNFADSTGAEGAVVTSDNSGTQNIAGAAAAPAIANPNASAHIEIVETTPVAATKKPVEKTVIPF